MQLSSVAVVLILFTVRAQGLYLCSFDDEVNPKCGWNLDTSNSDLPWVLKYGPSPQPRTGPPSDRSGNGKYLLAQTSTGEAGSLVAVGRGQRFRMASPSIDTGNRNLVLRFYYYMWGKHVGVLNAFVVVKGIKRGPKPIWRETGSQFDMWIMAEIRLPVNVTAKVVFEMVSGKGTMGDVAIDDISVEEYVADCTFEPETAEAPCNFTQDRNDHFDWQVNSGKTTTRRTGPTRDHTLRNAKGTYMYLEATGQSANDVAYLVSPVYIKDSGAACNVSFFYHMYGEHIGSLTVLWRRPDDATVNDVSLFSRTGEQEKTWLEGSASLTDYGGRYEIVFMGSLVGGIYGDIGIDDFKLIGPGCLNREYYILNGPNMCSSGPCQNGGVCSNTPTSYTCNCTSSWTGVQCETKIIIDVCASNPCMNNGQCIEVAPATNDSHVTNATSPSANETAATTSPMTSLPPIVTPAQTQSPLNGTQTRAKAPQSLTSGTSSQANANQSQANATQTQSNETQSQSNGTQSQANTTQSQTNGTEAQTSGTPSQTSATQSQTSATRTQSSENETQTSATPTQSTGTQSQTSETPEAPTFMCVCPDGWTGALCDEVDYLFDPCDSNPCAQGGTCRRYDGNYTCECPREYSGRNCENDFDECVDSNRCENGGTCVNTYGGFNCTCPDGFYGHYCDLACIDEHESCAYWSGIQECDINPRYMLVYCRQSCGVCSDYVCHDKNPSCERWAAIGECTKNPFYMLGNCHKSCEVCLDNECAPRPCWNGGTCVDGNSSYTCLCNDGFEGHDCEIDIDECASAPCENNGTCWDDVNGFTCNCTEDYEGPTCGNRTDLCSSSPCENGATCSLAETGFNCTCATGFEGDTCEIDIDECVNNPCRNGGTCTDHPGGFICNCTDVWTGPTCELDFNECQSNPCLNGGSCFHGIGQALYFCHCIGGWEGTNCEQEINECASNPCMNAATCVDGINEFSCTCVDGWTGNTCETDINECASNPCHGGVCVDQLNRFTCLCEQGLTAGVLCEINIDPCQSAPCLNGGACTAVTFGHICRCERDWTGRYCETRITTTAPPTTTTPPTTPTTPTAQTTTTDDWLPSFFEESSYEFESESQSSMVDTTTHKTTIPPTPAPTTRATPPPTTTLRTTPTVLPTRRPTSPAVTTRVTTTTPPPTPTTRPATVAVTERATTASAPTSPTGSNQISHVSSDAQTTAKIGGNHARHGHVSKGAQAENKIVILATVLGGLLLIVIVCVLLVIIVRMRRNVGLSNYHQFTMEEADKPASEQGESRGWHELKFTSFGGDNSYGRLDDDGEH